VWAKEGNDAYVRFMYLQNGAVLEDPGTGSACANLGGLHLLQQKTPLACRVRQGVLLGRENVLYLEVNQQDDIWIGGQNCLMGEGQLIWNEN
jgi:predicted PhzF superfamily epimerase YddE/YHI9